MLAERIEIGIVFDPFSPDGHSGAGLQCAFEQAERGFYVTQAAVNAGCVVLREHVRRRNRQAALYPLARAFGFAEIHQDSASARSRFWIFRMTDKFSLRAFEGSPRRFLRVGYPA